MAEHECPGGCGRKAPQHQLACKGCWWRLPKALRDWLNSAYRYRVSEPKEHREALVACLTWYRNNPRQVPS